jgi:hypothetical protein
MINPTLSLPFVRGGDNKVSPLRRGRDRGGLESLIIMLATEIPISLVRYFVDPHAIDLCGRYFAGAPRSRQTP